MVRDQNSPYEQGQVLILCVLVLPLFLVISLLIGRLGHVLLHSSQNLGICRQSLSHLQNKMGDLYQKLKKLNPKARRLRQELEIAKQKLNGTIGLPPFNVGAAAYYADVRRRQALLAAQQQFLLRRAEGESINALQKLRTGLRSFSVQVPYKKSLAVRATPHHSLTPDYKPKPQFSRFQSVQAKWVMRPQQMMPSFLLEEKFLDQSLPYMSNLEQSCAATIQLKQGNKWQVIFDKK